MSLLNKEAIGEKLKSLMNRSHRTQNTVWDKDMVQVLIDINDSKLQSVLFSSPSGPILEEIPSPALDGTSTIFTTSIAFAPASLRVFLNGMKIAIVEDYLITGPGQFTLFVAPAADETLSVTFTPL